MKKTLVMAAILATAISANAQDKKLDKIKELYDAQQYTECIENAKKYNTANTQKADGYFYLGLSQYELYKQNPQKEFQLTQAENSIYQAIKKDKNNELSQTFAGKLDEMHSTITELQEKHWESGDKGKAGQHAGMLAKLWQDTTQIWRRVYQPELFVQPITRGKQLSAYEGPTNETDVMGRKQGVWIDKYPNGVRKSQITFEDGKPKGDYYKFYPNGGICAHLYIFNEQKSSAILYDENGDKVAMGYYHERKKDSLWQYFQGDSLIVSEETWNRGIKNGKETTYYPFGFAAEEINWKNGIKDGPWKRFYESSTPMFETTYKNGKIDGKYTKYDIKGTPIIIGNYHNDSKEGTWTIYDEKTKSYKHVKYKNGQPENIAEIDEEFAKQMDELMKNANLLPDPMNYRDDPSQFPTN
ncbi:MAG: toxin-antitoxin system YwqK family antitoxin [Bacteroidales bacterium]|nr:toxin-antitoxin system YwqK family antitoxin [Bacteroidales bacterium]